MKEQTNDPVDYGWKKVDTDSYKLGEYELRRLNTGNFVFRHNYKDQAYITIGHSLTPEMLETISNLIRFL